MHLQDIPVCSEGLNLNDESHVLDAVILQIKQLMDVFIVSEKTAAIDLRSLPLSRKIHDELKERLGVGEVEAKVKLSGDTEVYETAFSGVWWVTHKNSNNKIIAEQIEVGNIPFVLCAHIEDIKIASKKLAEKMM